MSFGFFLPSWRCWGRGEFNSNYSAGFLSVDHCWLLFSGRRGFSWVTSSLSLLSLCVCVWPHTTVIICLLHTHTHTFIYTHPGMIGDYFRWWRKWRIHADSPFSHSRNLTTRLKLPVSRRNNGPPWPQSPGPFFSNYPDIHSWFIKSSFKKKIYVYIYLFIYLFIW